MAYPTIHWFLFGGETAGGPRIHGYAIHRYLLGQGVQSLLHFSPPEYAEVFDIPWDAADVLGNPGVRRGDVAIFDTLSGQRTVQLAQALTQKGVFCLFVECDLREQWAMANACHATVCSSRYLADQYATAVGGCVVFIPDAVEEIVEGGFQPRPAEDRLRLGWVGNRWHFERLDRLRDMLARERLRDLELITISDHPAASHPWSLRGAFSFLKSCDIIVIPTENDRWAMAKSNNRLTQAMALGVPVVAGRIPAYEEVVVEGENGFLCDTPEEWERALTALRDPAVRLTMARKAYALVQDRFTIERIGRQWHDLLVEVAGRPIAAPQLASPASFGLKKSALVTGQEYYAYADSYLYQHRLTQARQWGFRAAWHLCRASRFWQAARIMKRLWLGDLEVLWLPRAFAAALLRQPPRGLVQKTRN
jgi:hypothetical protein